MAKQPLPKSRRRRTKREQEQGIPTWVWFAGGGVVALLLVVGLFWLGNQGGAASAGADIEGVEILPDPGRGHQDGDIAYASDAPAGGPHNPTWLNCGIYEEPIREENVVHSLEHGAVWLAYQPDLSEDQIDLLRNIVRQERRSRREPLIVMAPKPDLESPIVATAWQARLRLENASDERLQAFLDRFQRGPFTPEPGAACAGGIGEPLS